MGKLTRRRALRSGLAVGVGVALAGCSSVLSAHSIEDAPERVVEEIPGVEDGRVVSASALADAHHDIVVTQSATRRGTITHSPLAPGHGRATVSTETRIDDDTFFYRVVPQDADTERVREEYIDGRDHYVAHYEGGEWTVEPVGGAGGTSRTWLTGNSPLMALSEVVRVVGTEVQYGAEHYLFSRQADDDAGGDADGPSPRGRYLLSDEGVCRELMTIEQEADAPADVRQVVEWSLTDIGNTSVSKPEWIEQVA